MILFAFDRDNTVDTGNGPVPLALVKQLASRSEVWAIGNQALKDEAGIPGLDEIKARADRWNDYADPTGWTPEEIASDPVKRTRHVVQKRLRVFTLGRLFPDAMKIAVDDYEIIVEGWQWYSPEDFMELARAFGWPSA
jgi:hypothetical protein